MFKISLIYWGAIQMQVQLNQSDNYNLSIWSSLLSGAQEKGLSVFWSTLYHFYYQRKSRVLRVPSLDLIQKTIELLNKIPDLKDVGARETLDCSITNLTKFLDILKGKLETRYYSGIFGTLRKMLSIVTRFFHFKATRHATLIEEAKGKARSLGSRLDRTGIEEIREQLKEIPEREEYAKKLQSPLYLDDRFRVCDLSYFKALDENIDKLWARATIPSGNFFDYPLEPVFNLLSYEKDTPERLKVRYFAVVRKKIKEGLSSSSIRSQEGHFRKKWAENSPQVAQIFEEEYQAWVAANPPAHAGQTRPPLYSYTPLYPLPTLPPSGTLQLPSSDTLDDRITKGQDETKALLDKLLAPATPSVQQQFGPMARVVEAKSETKIEPMSDETKGIRQALHQYAKEKKLVESDAEELPRFQEYLKAFDVELPAYPNRFINFVACWKKIEACYTAANLAKIRLLEEKVPARFRARHQELMQ